MSYSFFIFFRWRFLTYITFLQVFYTSISWWSFTGGWVAINLLGPLELFSVFWPTSTVVWMVSSRLPASNSSSLFSKSLGIVSNTSVTAGIKITVMFHSFFGSLARSRYLYLFCFLWFLLCDPPGRQNPLDGGFSFLINYH